MRFYSSNNPHAIYNQKYKAYTAKLSIPIYWIRQGQSVNLIINPKEYSTREIECFFSNPQNQTKIENNIRRGKYQRGDVSETGVTRFKTYSHKFEQYICNFSYDIYKVWECGTAYIIDKSIIIYVSIKAENQEQFVIEEIFSDHSVDLDFRFFEKNNSMITYWAFTGELGYCNPYRISNYLLINDLFPNFRIDELFDKWLGTPLPFAAFEIMDSDLKGIAICQTNAKQTYTKILDIGSDIFYACLTRPKHADIMENMGLKYYIGFDDNMYQIIMKRSQDTFHPEWLKTNKSSGRYRLEEEGMKFCWLTAYIKGNVENIYEKIITDIRNGAYDDSDWQSYTVPEGKWKSEQLLYEIVKQIYPQKSVFYQYRPSFLLYQNRQLSYDIYIPSLKIAFEYQGKQHFEPVDFFGGEESFIKQKERDKLKKKLSESAGVCIVYINYWDSLSIELVKERIKETKSNS